MIGAFLFSVFWIRVLCIFFRERVLFTCCGYVLRVRVACGYLFRVLVVGACLVHVFRVLVLDTYLGYVFGSHVLVVGTI